MLVDGPIDVGIAEREPPEARALEAGGAEVREVQARAVELRAGETPAVEVRHQEVLAVERCAAQIDALGEAGLAHDLDGETVDGGCSLRVHAGAPLPVIVRAEEPLETGPGRSEDHP